MSLPIYFRRRRLDLGSNSRFPKSNLRFWGSQDLKHQVLNQRYRLHGAELTSELIRAARALLRWEQRDLAEASAVSLATIKRLEAKPGAVGAYASTVAALKRALESAGIDFIDENGGGQGVRLNKRRRGKQS